MEIDFTEEEKNNKLIIKYNNLISYIIEGFYLSCEDMKREGIFNDKTTFEDIAEYAGRRILLDNDEVK